MIRDSVILDKTYLGPFEHNNKLKVGNVQAMSWLGSEYDGS